MLSLSNKKNVHNLVAGATHTFVEFALTLQYRRHS